MFGRAMFEAMQEKLGRILLSKEERWERLDKLSTSDPAKYQRLIETMSEKEVDEYLDSVTSTIRDGISLTEIKVVDEVVQLRVVPAQEIRVTPTQDIIDPDYHWEPGMEHHQPKPPAKKRRPEVFERPAMNREARRKANAVARRNAGKDKA